jgi:hypothetical protein
MTDILADLQAAQIKAATERPESGGAAVIGRAIGEIHRLRAMQAASIGLAEVAIGHRTSTVAAERERCARIAETITVRTKGHPQIDAPTPHDYMTAIADAIRRGEYPACAS